ncbi:MAG: hypothetical protein UHX00_03345 [Caryophanon sp.]|nr:hypothetical protein [Caryophanon sp.]
MFLLYFMMLFDSYSATLLTLEVKAPSQQAFTQAVAPATHLVAELR